MRALQFCISSIIVHSSLVQISLAEAAGSRYMGIGVHSSQHPFFVVRTVSDSMDPLFSRDKKVVPRQSLGSPTISLSSVLALRGGDVERRLAVTADYAEHIEGAYGWCVNLGAPSALIAGAVVATLYENMHSGDLDIAEDDTLKIQFAKKLTRLLLLSAFALETVSIFVTTVTGTMLLSRESHVIATSDVVVNTALEFLKENYEFEYLTARITFLQGLLNWLAAIALGHILPSADDPKPLKSVKSLNNFIACSLASVIVLMLSFYNDHMTFYRNYGEMLSRWLWITHQRFFRVLHKWPPAPLSLILGPALITCVYWGYQSMVHTEYVAPVADGTKNGYQTVTKPRNVKQILTALFLKKKSR